MSDTFKVSIGCLLGAAATFGLLWKEGRIKTNGIPFSAYRQIVDGHEYAVFQSSNGSIFAQHAWSCSCFDEKNDGICRFTQQPGLDIPEKQPLFRWEGPASNDDEQKSDRLPGEPE